MSLHTIHDEARCKLWATRGGEEEVWQPPAVRLPAVQHIAAVQSPRFTRVVQVSALPRAESQGTGGMVECPLNDSCTPSPH